MSAVSSSTNPIADFNRLKDLREKNRNELFKTAKTQIEYHTCNLDTSIADLMELRSSKMLDGCDEKFVSAQYMRRVPEAGELHIFRAFTRQANLVYSRSRLFWIAMERLVLDRPKTLQADDFSRITAEANQLTHLMGNCVPYPEAVVKGGVRRVILRYMDGTCPSTGLIKKNAYIKRVLGPKDSSLEFYRKDYANMQNVFALALFKDDPSQTAYCMIPVEMEENELGPETDQEHSHQIHITMQFVPTENHLVGAARLASQMTPIFIKFLDDGKKTVADAMTRLQVWEQYDARIANTILPKPVVQISTPTESYASANKKAHPKKKKSEFAPCEDTINEHVPVETAKVEIEKPRVKLADREDYNTFIAILAKDSKLSWERIVKCLRALGFTVTEPRTGGNTWKFSWKNRDWLRNEQTFEGAASETFVKEQAGTASRAFHEPHHGSLSTRAPLDPGRIQSFKKLLTECLFDAEGVTCEG